MCRVPLFFRVVMVFLVAMITCPAHALEIQWSFRGRIPNMHNIRVYERTSGWDDNYLATDKDYGITWSPKGRVMYMSNVQFLEKAGGALWQDNYFVIPNDLQKKYQFEVSTKGRIPGKICVPIIEPNGGGAWTDNYLCYNNVEDQHFEWSYKGPISGMHCIRFDEPATGAAWRDNYLCSDQDYGIRWSNKGPISGMDCLKIDEGEGGAAWLDNYLCTPENAPFGFLWSCRGPITGARNLKISEPSMGAAWDDNYLAIAQSAPVSYAELKEKVREFAPILHIGGYGFPIDAANFSRQNFRYVDAVRNDREARVYVNVKVRRYYTDFQYWFLFAEQDGVLIYPKIFTPSRIPPFGGWKSQDDRAVRWGGHYGDWEHVTVRMLNESGKACQVYFAPANTSMWTDISKVRDQKTDRIHVYAAEHSNEIYGTNGRQYSQFDSITNAVICTKYEFRIVDRTNHLTQTFDSRKRLSVIGLSSTRDTISQAERTAVGLETPSFLRHTGNWGATSNKGYDKVSINEGDFGSIECDALNEYLQKHGVYGVKRSQGDRAPWSQSCWTSTE